MAKEENVWMQKPYLVCHSNGQPVSGHDTEEEAKGNCADRNDRASKLGIKARYTVKNQS